MKIRLSDHFTLGRLLRFTLPSMVMMVFTSIYTVVDGYFISNFAGITPFAAINIIFPFIQILGCIGFMFGAGGTALVSKSLGEGNRERANAVFSELVYVALGIAVLLAALGIVLIKPVAVWLGADADMLPYCVNYGRIVLAALPFFMLQNIFQSFLVTAEKPGLGLAVTVSAGLTNIVLDALLVAVLQLGVAGAAVATALSQTVGGVIPLIYFIRGRGGLLRLTRTSLDFDALFKTATNGASEVVTNISLSVVSILYNFQLMRLAGETGVAAYGAVMYVSFAFIAIFLGFAIGSAPIIGFHYGAGNRDELRGIFRRSNLFVGIAGAIIAFSTFLLAEPLAVLFLGRDATAEDPMLLEMSVEAFRAFSLSVLFSGFGIFGSSFFIALNDGAVSAAISFMRLLLFQVLCVLVLPIFFGTSGVWYSLFAAEALAMITTLIFFIAFRKKYGY
ncbi:MAG: MATE family efflux transporter [Clostridia bacterium]|nr:MATE family efflux transporter [Clostridia bacterium]